MRLSKILALTALLGLMPAAAIAQSSGNAQQFVALGYCQFTPDTATALNSSSCTIGGVAGVPAGAKRAVISVEAQAVRWRDDTVAPTTTVGMPIAVGNTVVYESTLRNLQFISQTAGAKVSVSFYRW